MSDETIQSMLRFPGRTAERAPSPDAKVNALRTAHGVFASIALDRTSLPQSSLDIARRVRTNPFPWTGQFSPQLVQQLLESFAPSAGVVLDPFAGSGTSLIESARLGLAAYGTEINPAAVMLSKVYEMANMNCRQRACALDAVRRSLTDAIGSPYGPLFCDRKPEPVADRAELEAALVRLWRDADPGAPRRLAAALVVLCDFHRNHLDVRTVHKTWFRLEKTVRSLPEAPHPIVVRHADARALPVAPGTVDMVLTSPPYINVHNYHQQFRRSAEALDCDVLSIARSEIGSNRQNRGNRFLTVIQYSLDMCLALRELARVTRAGARVILVVGRESFVRGGRFFNGELVAEIAVRCTGLAIERRQERRFRNRYGTDIFEDILHFRATVDQPDERRAIATTRGIAAGVLARTRPSIPAEHRSGIDDAMSRIDTASPSPMPVSSALSHG